MTRCEVCGQSLLAYAEMRRQRDALLAAAKAVLQIMSDVPFSTEGTLGPLVNEKLNAPFAQLRDAVKETENA